MNRLTSTVAISKTPRDVQIAVQDTGNGLPAEELINIFKPSRNWVRLAGRTFRPRSGPAPRSQHRGASRRHGERDERRPGQGSCFTVRMPIQPESR
jgi:signal transduction histidine kinase